MSYDVQFGFGNNGFNNPTSAAAWSRPQQPQQPQQAANTPSFADIFNSTGGTRSAFNKDSQPGTTVTGTLAGEPEVRQATDFQTKQPAYFLKSGKPKLEVVFDLQTDLRDDPDDDGRRSVWVHWWGVQRDALTEAFKQFGRKPHKGDKMTVTFDGFVQLENAPQPAKHYTFKFEAGLPGLAPQTTAAPATTTPAPAGAFGVPAVQGGTLTAQQIAQIQQLQAVGKTPDEVAALTGIPKQLILQQAGNHPAAQAAAEPEPEF
ncbi:MAG: hypothetical protein MR570_06470 [Bifidobacterium pseudolongum]|nr:hypothetical protein [Bifidobacterium pseudolongum]